MNTRECCAACLHTDRSLPHLSRFFSAQVCSATAKTIPCPPPLGRGSCVQRGREKKRRICILLWAHTHASARLYFLSWTFTLWDTGNVNGVGEEG